MTGNTNRDTIRGSIFNYNWGFLKPVGWPRLKKRIDRLHKKGEKLLAKIKSEQLTSTKNSRNLPNNVTIREEYVNCGKTDCSSCKHGPYFYAYWKDDNGKLRKKYIGKYRPPIENPNK